jgi:hypothetical protein
MIALYFHEVNVDCSDSFRLINVGR